MNNHENYSKEEQIMLDKAKLLTMGSNVYAGIQPRNGMQRWSEKREKTLMLTDNESEIRTAEQVIAEVEKTRWFNLILTLLIAGAIIAWASKMNWF